jgi:hypothetical protein
MKFLTQHLKDSQTSYFEHLKFAIYAGFLLFYAAIASIIHAIFPFFFKGTAAFIVIKLYKQRLENHPNPSYKAWLQNSLDYKKNT